MKIMKASAGSGKTYRLAQTYIDMLLGSNDRYAYRHLLAVTFTNKATAEMKGRILSYLAERAGGDSHARQILTDILHDYSAFAITTIDKFFQQALKAFSREIGQFADYQIELDRDSLIAESMDRILDSLTEDKVDLVNWLKGSVLDKLELGKKLDMDKGLLEMGKLLKSEDHRELAEKYGIDDASDFSKTRLDSVRTECRRVVDEFTAKALSMGIASTPGEKIKKPGKKALAASAELAELFDKPYRDYCTALIISNLIFSLGLAGEFYREFDALLKEKNIMCLDESNTILRDIIAGSDAPFVYEKLGVRFEDFLLDEFQDTSNIQWENFLPLLKESESRSGKSLVVGDVKQSIYRFRDSDWELLGHKVSEEFRNASVEPLQGNWRSTREVVEFNNAFFAKAAKALGLQDIYSDVAQTIEKKEEQGGFVRISFCDDQLETVLESVRTAIRNNARPGDIAILVRKKAEGAKVAEYLISKGYPVLSDDSLNLKSSIVVRRLVSLLSGLDNPDDRINSFLADSLEVEYPASYHSLSDLCESLLRQLEAADPETYANETLFIQAFMDDIQAWVDVNGNNIRYYLKHWEEKDIYIGTPENDSSIRILTVHKSKGLEAPYVIFPFAETVELYDHRGARWCYLDTAGTGLAPVLGGIYPVELSSSSEDTCFAEAYHEERRKQYVDNINIFYVALTRAKKCLHVISQPPSATMKSNIKKGKASYSRMTDILYEHIGSCEDRTYGEMYDFSRMDRPDASGELEFKADYPSIPLGGRLAPSADATDFFGEDGTMGPDASPRLKGVLLHDILSRVRVPEDLARAVEEEVRDGRLPADRAGDVKGLLSERMSAHVDWFVPGGDTSGLRNEVALFDEYGNEYRPDRVVLGKDSTIIIDFKFGQEKDSYLRQVGNYVSIYRKMGYPDVKGYLWYVNEDKVIEV